MKSVRSPLPLATEHSLSREKSIARGWPRERESGEVRESDMSDPPMTPMCRADMEINLNYELRKSRMPAAARAAAATVTAGAAIHDGAALIRDGCAATERP